MPLLCKECHNLLEQDSEMNFKCTSNVLYRSKHSVNPNKRSIGGRIISLTKVTITSNLENNGILLPKLF